MLCTKQILCRYCTQLGERNEENGGILLQRNKVSVMPDKSVAVNAKTYDMVCWWTSVNEPRYLQSLSIVWNTWNAVLMKQQCSVLSWTAYRKLFSQLSIWKLIAFLYDEILLKLIWNQVVVRTLYFIHYCSGVILWQFTHFRLEPVVNDAVEVVAGLN
jgi:hypothetical protein